jgi:hypothetical protein
MRDCVRERARGYLTEESWVNIIAGITQVAERQDEKEKKRDVFFFFFLFTRSGIEYEGT